MRNILLAIAVAMLPATFALAEPSNRPKPAKAAASGRSPPVKGVGAGNSCAAYGPGFVRIDGTETCMKIGGAVSIGVGGSSGSR
jgi:predicted secreted protein